jgi:hypothetical protein
VGHSVCPTWFLYCLLRISMLLYFWMMRNKAVRLSVELQQQGMLNRKNVVFVWLC